MADEASAPFRAVTLSAVFRLRDRLRDQVGFGHEGRPMEGDGFRGLTDDLAQALRPLGVPATAVVDSCRHLLGRPLDPDDLAILAWRLAGNLPRLRRGRPAPPWSLQDCLEWLPLQVVACRPAQDRRRRSGAWVAARALAGSVCPNVFEQFWTDRQCGFFASTVFGFDARRQIGYDRDPRSLARLRVYGLVTPESCRHGKPATVELRGTPTFLAENRQLIAVRTRGQPCPRGYDHGCGACPVGYAGDDACRYAVHPEPWTWRPCWRCGRDRPHDAALSRTVCVTCYLEESRRPAP